MREQAEQIIRSLADRNGGRITAEQVLEAARDPASPLHPEFEWDESKAAHQHRLDQARSLIRSIKVNVVTTTLQIKAPLFVRDPQAKPEQGYATLTRIKSDEDVAREVIVDEFTRAAAALARAKAVAAGLELPDAIEGLRQQIIDLKERVQPAATG